MAKNRQKTKKWKFKIVFYRRKRFNSKENYWKDWFSKTKLGPNWQKKFKKEVFEFKISLIPTGITENQNIVIGYRLIIFAHLFKLKPLLFIVFMMNFWIVSVIFRRSALHMLFGHWFLVYTSQVVSYFQILLVLFQLNSNLCCKSQDYIVSNLCQEPFLCDPSQLPKIPHFHSMSEANAWASAHALSMVTWYHQNIVDLLIE